MFEPEVICIGSATVDTFLTINQPFSSIKKGDKLLIQSIEKHTGGGATNSAVALSKLGLKTKTLIKLGNDHDSYLIIQELKKYKVVNLCRNLSKKNNDSAFIVTSTIDKDRIIYNHKGSSLDLSKLDFNDSNIKAKWIYLASPMGKTLNTVKEIGSLIKKRNISVLFNPSLYLAKQGYSKLKPILDLTLILILNKEEAQALLKITRNVTTFSLINQLVKRGLNTVIITNGPKELIAYHQKTIYQLFPPKTKVIDTTGAGDAFNSGVLAGIIKQYSFEDALRLGQINATSVIQHLGAKNKLLTEKEAKEKLKRIRVIKNVSRY